jgi:hypothetical protein
MTRVKTRDEHDSKWPEDRSVNVQIFRDSTRKQRSLDGKHSSLNREGNDIKGPHASAHKWGVTREATRRKQGANWAEMGPGRSAQASRPSPFRAQFGTPFDLAALQTIYSPPAKSHREIHSSFVAEERRREGTPFQRGEGRDGWLEFP